MKSYRRVDKKALSLKERLLTYVAQEVAPYQSCTDLARLCVLTRAPRYEVIKALGYLEREGFISWERAGGLNNIHFGTKLLRELFQQHPIKLVRMYRW